jgi:hypothetical protein
MKIKTFSILLILRILNKSLYIKLRSIFQLGYLFPKEGRFSTYLLKILLDENRKDKLLRIKVADRLKARKYVEIKDKSIKFPKIIWSGSVFTFLDYKKLPNNFYLKHNSSSGKNIMIEKTKYSLKDLNKWIKKSNRINYGWITREWYYSEKNYYLCETPISKKELIDYKFFCKDGKPFLLQVDMDRNKSHKRNIYLINKNGEEYKLLNCKLHYYDNKKNFKLPNSIKEAYHSAEKLSMDFDFIRVDLYIFKNKVYFGELTNIPGSGFEKFYPEIYDKIIFHKMNNLK